MPVTSLHCATCGADFVDSRAELVEHDEAICPSCGARNEFTREFAEAVQVADNDNDVRGSGAPSAHSEPEVRKPS